MLLLLTLLLLPFFPPRAILALLLDALDCCVLYAGLRVEGLFVPPCILVLSVTAALELTSVTVPLDAFPGVS